jgi:hypothetical protein
MGICLQPLFGTITSSLFLGERITLQHVLGGLIICAAVASIVYARNQDMKAEIEALKNRPPPIPQDVIELAVKSADDDERVGPGTVVESSSSSSSLKAPDVYGSSQLNIGKRSASFAPSKHSSSSLSASISASSTSQATLSPVDVYGDHSLSAVPATDELMMRDDGSLVFISRQNLK